MKKIFALVLVLVMALSLVSCGKEEYTLGMGVVVSTSSSTLTNAQVDATVAAVVTDANGVIVACRIDVAQNKMNVTGGQVEADKTFETKMELGDRYGMAGIIDNDGDGVKLEWFEQAKAFEQHVVGMTADEVAAMRLQYVGGHYITTDADLLNAGCSMQITDFIQAVVKACDDRNAVSFKANSKKMTLGVAANSFVDGATKAATLTETGTVAMYSDFACAVVVKGKIVASLNDAIQPKFTTTIAGLDLITGVNYKGTKRELRYGYNMEGKVDANNDGVMNEWYKQSAAFSAHVVGMTADEVANMETAPNFMNYQMTTDADLLAAGCTIQITDIKAVVAEAARNAR